MLFRAKGISLSAVILLVFGFCFSFCVPADAGEVSNGSESYKVVFGERPPIDLDSVPKDAYEPGRMNVKFKPVMRQKNIQRIYKAGETGYAVLGYPEIDDLNSVFSVKNYQSMVVALYNVSPASLHYQERHKAWGLDLWYEVTLDSKADVIEAVKAFSRLSDVEMAEPVYKKQKPVADKIVPITEGDIQENPKYAPNDTYYYGNQWHYYNYGQEINGQVGTAGCDVDAQNAWDIEKGLNTVIVSVMDGGIDYDHEDISGNMWPTIGPDGTGTLGDDHGTHTSGTISAVTNNSLGVAGLAGGSGSSDGVRLMSIDIFDGSHGLSMYGIYVYGADNGACISQNSWGYENSGVYDQACLDGIDYFIANGGGSVMSDGIVIFAAGNSNSNAQWYPGYYSPCMAVAGTDNRDIRYSSSNYGSWVEISAPAVDVASTVTMENDYGKYLFYTGTSMACPHVSGVAAQMVSLAARNGLILSRSQVWDILVNTTDDHYPLNPSYTGMLGSGRLNAYLALQEVQGLLGSVENPSSFNATGVSQSQINLAWTKNSSNNSVMVAWSSTGTFGTPSDGTSYSVGNTIPGGGTVLYRGSGTSYSHTGLSSATTYYYKAFSYDSSNEYSSGVTADAATQCPTIDTFPYAQDFNASSSCPECWDIVDNQGNGQIWTFGTVSEGLSGTTGNYALLNSDGYGSGNTQNSDLVSPTFDFTGMTDVTLSFTHYFRQYQTSSTATLSYSINNGSSWTTLNSWTSSTSNPADYSQVISALAGQSQVKFKWNFTGTWGYYWCVDDIVIDCDTQVNTYPVVLYANPSDVGIVVNGSGEYQAGQTVNINTYPPQKGYVFVEWRGIADKAPGDEDLLDNPLSESTFFTMPSRPVTLEAYYIEESEPGDYTPAFLSLENPGLKGIWNWNYSLEKSPYLESKGSTWSKIFNGVTAVRIEAGDISDNGVLDVVALIDGQGLWYYDITGAQWINIISGASQCQTFTLARTTAGGPVEVVASFELSGTRKWTFNGSWSQLHSYTANILRAGNINRDTSGIDELVVVFDGYEGFFIYDFAESKFTPIITISPSQVETADITNDGNPEIVCVFDGYGVYMVRYLPDSKADMVSAEAIKPQFDLIRDIPRNHEWFSKDSGSKGFQFNRITYGSPDAGHYIATGDISADAGAEVILTYSGRTYYYTYTAKGWASLIVAPFKRITAGKFTGGTKDDLLASESNSGNLYLRVTATSTWENLASGASAGAMTALE